MFHRAPGGIGASSFPSRVWKGQHFPGHMGNAQVTAKNLRVVKIDAEENLMLVCGAVPGPKGSLPLDSQITKSKEDRAEIGAKYSESEIEDSSDAGS